MAKHDVLMALCVVGPMTRQELEKYLGLRRSSVGASIRALRADGRVCIVDWGPPSWAMPQVEIYGTGSVDKPRPPVRKNAEYLRERRAKVAQSRAQFRKLVAAGPWDQLL